MSRMLAAKAALMTRVDALGEAEEMDSDLGLQHRAALNRRLQFLEEGQVRRYSHQFPHLRKFLVNCSPNGESGLIPVPVIIAAPSHLWYRQIPCPGDQIHPRT